MEQTEKARKLVKENPEAATVAGGVAAVGAVKYGKLARAGYALKQVNKPGVASRLGHDLARSEGAALGEGDPFSTRVKQFDSYLKTRKKNKNVKYVRPTATRWSSTFRSNQRIRQANPEAKVRVRDVVFRPGKATAHVDRKILDRMIRDSPEVDRPLYRYQSTKRDSRGIKSFTDRRDVADYFGMMKQTQQASLPKVLHKPMRLASDGTEAVREYPAGKVKGVNIGAATTKYAQREWVGQVQKSAFGVVHKGLIGGELTEFNQKHPRATGGRFGNKAAKTISSFEDNATTGEKTALTAGALGVAALAPPTRNALKYNRAVKATYKFDPAKLSAKLSDTKGPRSYDELGFKTGSDTMGFYWDKNPKMMRQNFEDWRKRRAQPKHLRESVEWWSATQKAVQTTRERPNPLTTVGEIASGKAAKKVQAETLHQLLEAAPAKAPTLYRGLSMGFSDLVRYKPGEVVDIPITSWTSDKAVTTYFMNRRMGQKYGQRIPVMFELESGSKSLHIAPATKRRMKEWLSKGQYEVGSVEKQDGIYHIVLRQVQGRAAS